MPNFEELSPDRIISSIEHNYGISLNGQLTPYNSYINRVYGVGDDKGTRFIVKYYRPGRWSREAILEEHIFEIECAEAELPVTAPIMNRDKLSVSESEGMYFAIFPLRAGRSFDAERDEDWFRLGNLLGRLHTVGRGRESIERPVCHPDKLTRPLIEKVSSFVEPSLQDSFSSLSHDVLNLISPLFKDIDFLRIHGDCHRGNILDRMDEGLLLMDFDDMMSGPAVQDFWLLLPGHYSQCRREMEFLLDGYTEFSDFNRRELNLVEPLRFMRLIYFLSWCSIQQREPYFQHHFPGWGTKAFWIKEMEDLRYQRDRIEEHLNN